MNNASAPLADATSVNVSNGMLARLTAAKAISNGSFRWMAFFLPTLVVALSATTADLTTILGIGEMAGFVALFIGRHLDRNRERAIIVISLGLTVAGSLLAATGTLLAFAVGYVLIMLGVSLCTVSGHTYLGRRVLFTRRARAIGVFETSWALALLIGAPVAAFLISNFSWRAPLLAFAAVAAALAVVLWSANDDAVLLADAAAADTSTKPKLTRNAWLTVGASSGIAMCGLSTVVIAGTWLDEAFGLSTGGVGVIAMAFGAAELLASTGSAAIGDQVGPSRATRIAIVLAVAGLIVMTQAGSSLLVGGLGLGMFFLGFEFAIVTSFSVVSEAMPTARGRVLSINTGVNTFVRGLGVALSGLLYASFGIAGPAGLSIVAGIAAFLLLTAARRSGSLRTARAI